jgi:Phosphotransferase enzyme family
MGLWTDPAWLAEAHAWIAGHADPVGPIEQPHVYPWSTVLRVPTASGDVWFKANTAELRHEAAVVSLLAERRPDCVPSLLAADPERGWMLMADAGTRLRDVIERERDLGRWLDVLPLYAGVQVDLAADADALVALGAPDLRLAGLVERYERLLDGLGGVTAAERRELRGLVPEIEELRDELAAHGIPETIQHDDFHDGQVYVREGRYLLLDWGDACVSHPFFTLAVTLGGVIQWGLDDVEGSVELAPFRAAYLEPFGGNTEELVGAAVVAQRLGWICRAVNGHLPGDAVGTQRRLRMFVDGRP